MHKSLDKLNYKIFCLLFLSLLDLNVGELESVRVKIKQFNLLLREKEGPAQVLKKNQASILVSWDR